MTLSNHERYRRRRHGAVRSRLCADGATRIAIPRWIQLVGLPLLLLLAWTLAQHRRARRLPLRRRRADRTAAEPDRARAGPDLDTARNSDRDRLPQPSPPPPTFCVVALATVGVDHVRSSANRIDNYFTKTTPHTRPRAEHDVDRLQIWLNTHHLQRLKIRKQGLEFVRSINIKKRHLEGDQPDRGRGGERDRDPLQHHPRGRRLDLHAARHDPIGSGDRPSLPTQAGVASAPEPARVGARRLRQGPAAALADHRHSAPAWLCGCSARSAYSRTATATLFSSGSGSLSPS